MDVLHLIQLNVQNYLKQQQSNSNSNSSNSNNPKNGRSCKFYCSKLEWGKGLDPQHTQQIDSNSDSIILIDKKEEEDNSNKSNNSNSIIPIDIVIGSDIVYSQDLMDPLFATVNQLLPPLQNNNTSSNTNTNTNSTHNNTTSSNSSCTSIDIPKFIVIFDPNFTTSEQHLLKSAKKYRFRILESTDIVVEKEEEKNNNNSNNSTSSNSNSSNSNSSSNNSRKKVNSIQRKVIIFARDDRILSTVTATTNEESK